jgi:hypothetical protein
VFLSVYKHINGLDYVTLAQMFLLALEIIIILPKTKKDVYFW